MSAIPKPKRCRHCQQPFQPFNSLERVCSPRCGLAYARANPDAIKKLARQARRVEKRDDRERIKSRRDYEKEAQRAFNAFIRERDFDQPCISCDLPATYTGRGIWGRQWHASHYRSTGAAPELRFDEQNVHKSCANCNDHKSGNVVEYRIRLARKIGVDALARLEGPHPPAKRTTADLIAIRREYQVKLRKLREARA